MIEVGSTSDCTLIGVGGIGSVDTGQWGMPPRWIPPRKPYTAAPIKTLQLA